MKAFFLAFALFTVLLAAYPFLKSSDEIDTLKGLPWQITIFPDGSTQVFDLHIGVSRLADALEILGSDMDIAIIAATDEVGNLEMYYGHYRTGLLSGKLILQTDIQPKLIKKLKDNAAKVKYMASGQAKKYILTSEDLPQIMEQVIIGLTFIPSVNLNEEVIQTRFGTPARLIQSDGVKHYLYPDKGLHIALHAKSKEVLQYVSPEQFQQLVQPLQ